MSDSNSAVAEPPVEQIQEQIKPQRKEKPASGNAKPKQLPPYRVLLHNDEVSDMVFVVRTICKLTPLAPNQAIMKMLEAHFRGVTLLLVTHKERAELYAEQFTTFKLKVTIEPAD